MRIFGLNITRQSTYDIKEAESFKAIISLISTGCTTMRRMISSDLNIENGSISLFIFITLFQRNSSGLKE